MVKNRKDRFITSLIRNVKTTVSNLDVAGAVSTYLVTHPVMATWEAITGKPEVFAPDAHTHTEDEITDLSHVDPTALHDKADIEAFLTGEIDSHSHAGSGMVRHHMSVELVKDGAASLADTNATAALRFFLNRDFQHSTKVDLSDCTQVRLVAMKVAVAGAVNYKIIVKYVQNWTTVEASWSDIGTSEVSVAGNVQNQPCVSEWIDLAAGAKGDVFVALMTSGGDGALDPAWGHVTAEFR